MKHLLITALAALSLNASAQTEQKALYDSKNYDNWYIGVNGGLATKTTHSRWIDNLNSNAGMRIGHWFTPVFGLALESNAYFGDKPQPDTGTMVKYLSTDLAATVNLTNMVLGYKGEPRVFEVIAVPALGIGHVFTNRQPAISRGLNDMTGKLAVDLAFNVDKKKSLQLYLEPALLYSVYGNTCNSNELQLDINRSHFQLNLGLVYKFKNTNGTHNFRYAEPQYRTDQAEIDRLNGRIAELMAENEELRNRPVPSTTIPRHVTIEKLLLESVVVFAVNSSDIPDIQYANIERVANCMKENSNLRLLITGYSSTEGPADLNQKISLERAEAVKKSLVEDYDIPANRLQVRGNGATDQQSERREFNRVVTFTVIE